MGGDAHSTLGHVADQLVRRANGHDGAALPRGPATQPRSALFSRRARAQSCRDTSADETSGPFGQRTEGWFGSIIDVFAIVVTLGGTSISLGIGALLTAMFVVSAVSGINRT